MDYITNSMEGLKMNVINEKTDWLLKCGKKYVYRIFLNGNGEITISVETRRAFNACSLDEMAVRTLTIEQFSKVSVEWINKTFNILRCEVNKGMYF